MSTKIEWCNETWNPIVGCTKVSPGCDNCYAERMATGIAAMSLAADYVDSFHNSGLDKYRKVIYEGRWKGVTCFNETELERPLKWKKPRMIFVCSMGDIFHETVFGAWLEKIFRVIEQCPHHTFLLLTKRPHMAQWYSESSRFREYFKLPNLWLGVTVENQEQAYKRVPVLLSIPAAKRFVSVEPMLGQVDLINVYYSGLRAQALPQRGFIDWVICGGESGPGARPVDPEWVRFLQVQCKIAEVPFFFKSWGEFRPFELNGNALPPEAKGRPEKSILKRYANITGSLFRRVGKKRAGCLLDGKSYKEYPVINL